MIGKEWSIYGAAYDEDLALVPSSLRASKKAYLKHRDPAYLFDSEVANSLSVKGSTVYLGHCFGHYGHFLLETLPMLSVLLPDGEGERKTSFDHAIFLPFWEGGETLLNKFLSILFDGKDRSNIIVWDKSRPIDANITVMQRPIIIKDEITDFSPYRKVISRLTNQSVKRSHNMSSLKRIFLKRAADRFDPLLGQQVERQLCCHGFVAVSPEDLRLDQQIFLMWQADYIVGFSGSQLHNALFVKENTTIIEIGDERSPSAPFTNQRLCCEVSRSNLVHVTYRHNQKEISDQVLSFL